MTPKEPTPLEKALCVNCQKKDDGSFDRPAPPQPDPYPPGKYPMGPHGTPPQPSPATGELCAPSKRELVDAMESARVQREARVNCTGSRSTVEILEAQVRADASRIEALEKELKEAKADAHGVPLSDCMAQEAQYLKREVLLKQKLDDVSRAKEHCEREILHLKAGWTAADSYKIRAEQAESALTAMAGRVERANKILLMFWQDANEGSAKGRAADLIPASTFRMVAGYLKEIASLPAAPSGGTRGT